MTVRSLYVGLTGLTAMGQGIDVISNNIANVNTVGFKAGRASFDDIFYQTMFIGTGATENRGGINPRQLGVGVKTGSIETIFTQGSHQNTGRLMDLSIQGDGFFVLRDNAGQEFLSRAGNFSLDNEGFVVDPANGYRLVGRPADENGEILDTEAPSALLIDFDRKSLAKQTENVIAQGNFDARTGDPNSGQEVQRALQSSNLLGLFDDGGDPFGLVNGDVIRFETGFLDLGDPPNDIESPLDLSEIDAGRGRGVLLTITETTTVADLRDALNDFFNGAIRGIKPGAESGIEVNFNSQSGAFEFNNTGTNSLSGVRTGLSPRAGGETVPEASRRVGNWLINDGDPDFSKTLNVPAESTTVKTNGARRADSTSSIDIFDSQGNSHTLTLAMAADIQSPPARAATPVSELRDSEGRMLIPGGAVPPEVQYSEPVVDTGTNTAVYTASQISNIVATKGIYSFQDGNGNLVALRLSDGALSFNGGAFNAPVSATGDIDPEFAAAGVDVTGDTLLNIPSAVNGGGGLLGDEGFTETTTLEDIRKQLEERINGAIRQVALNIANIDAATSTLQNVPANGFAAPADFPSEADRPVGVVLNADGGFTFSVSNGSLGAAATDDEQIAADLATAAGGDDQLALSLDLAAKTRSIRVSTVDPGPSIADTTDDTADGKVDDDLTDGGGVTGFIRSGDPFAADAAEAFAAGNTDFGLLDTTGDPTIPLANGGPTGIDDSGVHLVALGSGQYGASDALTAQRFDGFEAFAPEVTAFRALFNQRGYGIPMDFDGTPGADRTGGVPAGVVAEAGGPSFETNTIHGNGTTRNTVNYQTVLPSDFRTPPNNTTGSMIFDSNGRFERYGNGTEAPTVSFDPDNSDPENGGVDPITFKMDLSNITHFFARDTSQLETQDGRAVGNLDNVNIASNGEIIGVFTNGDIQSLGQVLLGKVRNEGGLIQEGDTLFTVAPNSGERVFVEAGSEGDVITSGALELSNVDLAQEFTNLIVTQRAYSANSRVITTGDQILQEVLNLKR